MELISVLTYIHQVTEQVLDERLGRTVTRVVLPRVVMHSRHHYGVSASSVLSGVCRLGGYLCTRSETIYIVFVNL